MAFPRTLAGRVRGARGSAVVACLGVALALVGCTTSNAPIAPTPADFAGIAQDLRARGITVTDVVSGDAGCPDVDLARSAISFRMSGLDQATPVAAHLYVFGSQAAFERRAGDVAACSRSYVTDPADLESFDVSPYVVVGQGPWAQALRAALREGLTVAAGNGGNGAGPPGGPP